MKKVRLVGDFTPYLRVLATILLIEGVTIASMALLFEIRGDIGSFVLFAMIGFAAVIGHGILAFRGLYA